MLWRELKAWQIYGANTDVGKTILSTVLSKALARRVPKNGLLYLKPVSTGPDNEADDRHISKHAPGVVSKVISQFARPVSPHLAARDFHDRTDLPQSDSSILVKVKDVLDDHSRAGGRYALLETAGGVLSPGPSGTVQADLYRPLRLPVILMGDSKLGGIATTISAFESLHLRGYDVESVLLFDDPQWGNHDYLQEHFQKHNIKAFSLPLPPARVEDVKEDQAALADYYEKASTSRNISSLLTLLDRNHFNRISKLTSMPSHAESIIWHPFRQHGLPQNIIAIDSAYDDHFQAYNAESDPNLLIPESGGMTMFNSERSSTPLLTPLFDASASWWTQGLGHGSPGLSLTAAYAAGRYGHVMFASAVHEPALDLCYNLLSTLQNPRLSRVFFTDNGSTGMEVAIKMALRASCARYGWNKDDQDAPVGILGMKGSYHGDTIGVMNCSDPNIFNEKTDWYKPWGYWFTPPEIKMKKGKWHLELPEEIVATSTQAPSDKDTTFTTLSSVFDFSTASRAAIADIYKAHITTTLKKLVQTQGRRFGALILEPLIMGAGGMILVDPLFQRTLITTIREHPDLISLSSSSPSQPSTSPQAQNNNDNTWSGLPLISDEVFTGLYRLGRPSSSSFWNTTNTNTTISNSSQPLDTTTAPDISVHAKLLTGGLLPLALTTASASIFNTFVSESKTDALLHGHSYTAHPVGCAVANKSLQTMAGLERAGGDWAEAKRAWSAPATGTGTAVSSSPSTPTTPSTNENSSDAGPPTTTVFSLFSPVFLHTLSHHEKVSSCFAVGTVLSFTVASGAASGYANPAAASLQARLLTTMDEEGAGVHSRVLGDVIYFMTSLTTTLESVKRLEGSILRALDAELAKGR